MRVDVDETGRDERAIGVDLVPPFAVHASDRGDHPVGDGDVGRAGIHTGAVDDGSSSDDEIVHFTTSR